MKKLVFIQLFAILCLFSMNYAQTPATSQSSSMYPEYRSAVINEKAPTEMDDPIRGPIQGTPASIWYFGYNAGLDFKTDPPTILTDGMLYTREGCSSISDDNGILLFYTDGSTVYTKTHVIMPNGTGLLGNNSSTQSALIVNDPGNSNQYYIFAVSAFEFGPNNITYNIVDLTLNGGLGDVTVKNQPLLAGATEGINAVPGPNASYFWIIAQKALSSNIYAFKLDGSGINMTPVISPVAKYLAGSSELSFIKPSPAGNKIAITNFFAYTFEVFNFDNVTGILSNQVLFNLSYNPYGCEFSPDGNIIYVAPYYGSIQQYNIANSFSLFVVPGSNVTGAMQLAPNGKIYVCYEGSTYLDVINDPNVAGAGCNFVNDGQYLGGRISALGLPTVVAAYVAGITPDPEEVPLTNWALYLGIALIALFAVVRFRRLM